MHDYVIITDSTCDLSASMAQQYGLTAIPLQFTINHKDYANYLDGSTLPFKEFYAILRSGQMSTTSQVSYNTFVEYFEPVLESGKDILYIGFSSALSGTFNSSLIAKADLSEKYPQRKIICIDSLCASGGEGMLVYHAALKRDEGLSIEELAAWITEKIPHLCHWFTVDDLNHLKRGGRVSAVAAVIGTALGVKPVLHVDDEGRLIPMSKARGRAKAIEALLDKMAETCVDPQSQTVFISHGDDEPAAQKLADMIREKLKVENFVIHYIGPVVGAHSGPGTIALFFFGTKR